MLHRLESITRIVLLVVVLASFIDDFFVLNWINQKSPYFFLPILILAVSSIALQIINFFIKRKQNSTIDT